MFQSRFSWQKSLAVLSGILLSVLLAGEVQADRGIHGRVYGLDENGDSIGTIEGATIALRDLAGSVAAETQSGEGGYYRIEVAPGRYTFKVSAPDFKDEDQGRGLEVQMNDGYAVFNVSLIRGKNDASRTPPAIPKTAVATLSGSVKFDNQGYQEGVPDAIITLKGPGDARQLVRVICRGEDRSSWKAAGQYTVNLPIGTWRASVSAKDFDTLVEKEPITLTAGQTTTHDFIFKQKTRPDIDNQGIKARITSADILSGAEVPPSYEVYIIDSDEPLNLGSPLTADPQGFFARNLRAGTYRVIASTPGYSTAWSAPIEVVRSRYSVVNLSLTKQPAVDPPEVLDKQGIRGVVEVDDPNANPDQIAKVLEQTEVYIAADDETSTLTNPIYLDEQGRFSRALPLGGPYKVIAIARDYEPVSVLSRVLPEVYSDVRLKLLPATKAVPMPKKFILNAVVLERATSSSERQPIANASVLLRGPNQVLSEAPRELTDDNGNVRFEVSELGNYAMLAQKSGYVPSGTRISVTESEPIAQEIRLQRVQAEEMPIIRPIPRGEPISMNGFVVSRDNAARSGIVGLPGAIIRWIRTDGDRKAGGEVTTRQAGAFQIELPEGEYQFDVYPPSDKRSVLGGASEKLAVASGIDSKYFFLRPLGNDRPTMPREPVPEEMVTVNGMVVVQADGRFVPVSGALLSWSGGPKRNLPAVKTQRDGRFSITLDPSTYHVAVKAPPGLNDSNEIVNVTSGMPPRYIILTPRSRIPDTRPAESVDLTIRVLEASDQGSKRALENAVVSIERDRQAIARKNTDSSGQVSFKLPPGAYQIQTARFGYDPENAVIQLKRDPVRHDVYLHSSRPSDPIPSMVTLNVQVGGTNPSQGNRVSLLPGAQVGITQNGRPITAGTTNRDGVFSARLAPGKYSVSASYQTFQTVNEPITVASGTVDHRLLLKPAAMVRPNEPAGTELKLQVGGINPRGGNQVSLLERASITIYQNRQKVATGTTNAGGVYSVRLAPGRYEIEVGVDGYYSKKELLELPNTATSHRILLSPRRTIQ